MTKATLKKDRVWKRDYEIPDGRIITLKLEQDYSQVTFWEKDKQLGKDEDFIFLQEEFSSTNSYLLARMYVPIKKSGLGRAALQFFTEMSGATVYCRPHDGNVRDDGSHLTEDALNFVAKMQEEGLIEEEEEDFDEYPEDY